MIDNTWVEKDAYLEIGLAIEVGGCNDEETPLDLPSSSFLVGMNGREVGQSECIMSTFIERSTAYLLALNSVCLGPS